MAKTEIYALIETQEDFKNYYDNFKKARMNGEDTDFVLSPDFDINIIYSPNITNFEPAYHAYISMLAKNTAEVYKKEEVAEIVNKILDSVKNKWTWKTGGIYSQDVLNNEVLENGANSVIAFLQGFLFVNNSILLDKKNPNQFSKYITPENQVIFNMVSGFKHDYNFSEMQFENLRMIESVLPREKNEYLLTSNEKKLMEKFNHDFYPRKVDYKKIFPDAKKPELLYDLRRGKIDAYMAMQQMDKDDYKFILPSRDFVDLAPDRLYELMSKPGLNWSTAQVRSFMNLIIDKAQPTRKWLDDIMRVMYANKAIFMTQTEDNLNLWVKIESKYRELLNLDRDYVTGIKIELEKARRTLQQNAEDIGTLVKKHDLLQRQNIEFNQLNKEVEMLRDHDKDETDYFYFQAGAVLEALNMFYSQGVAVELEIPEKPWRLFAFDKERKFYNQLVDVINKTNKYVKKSVEERNKVFGEHEFHMYEKLADVTNIIKSNDREGEKANRYIAENENVEMFSLGYVDKEIEKQKTAKTQRYDAAKAKMKEKGIITGQKSGVVKADSIAKQTRIKNKMEQLRTNKAYKGMSEEQLRAVATNILYSKEK